MWFVDALNMGCSSTQDGRFSWAGVRFEKRPEHVMIQIYNVVGLGNNPNESTYK